MTTNSKYHDIHNELLRLYGPLIGGADLRVVLAYKSITTFNRAIRLKQIDLNVFEIPNRRGRFALTQDVARLIASYGENAERKEGE